MKISFWIPAIVLYVVSVAFSNCVQVGTVLFTTTDLVKKCWTESDKSLLKARLIMQDVLPDPDCIDFSNPEAVAILLEYFQSCYKIISTSTYGKLQNLMYLALSDALGGYLRGYVLPYTRRAYYAGHVKYEEAKKLFEFYDEIKAFLKSNGNGWIEPQKICCKKFHVKPLVITGGALEACKELYVIERPGKLHCINTKSGLENGNPKPDPLENLRKGFPEDPEKFSYHRKCPKGRQRRRSRKREKRRSVENSQELSFINFINSSSSGERFFKNWTRSRSHNRLNKMEVRNVRQCDLQPTTEATCESEMKRIIVPLPVIDDCKSPNTIAVPFMQQPLRNLKSGCSAFILEYYYLAVVKCFIAKGNTRMDIKNFNKELYSWLMTEVIPHLCEEQWYPGFGGVLRVLQTIKKFGIGEESGDPFVKDIEFMFDQGMEFDVEDEFDGKGKAKVRQVGLDESTFPNSERHVITTIIIVSLIWLFIFCAFAFYCQATRGHKSLYEGSFQPPENNPQDDNIKLQFLVRFFKTHKEDQDSGNINLVMPKFKGKSTPPVQQIYPKERATAFYMSQEKSSRKPGQGDCFGYFESLVSSVLPTEPYLSSFGKSVNTRRESGQGDQIKMLWKKPSMFFNESNASREGHETQSGAERTDTTVTQTESYRERIVTNSCSECLESEKCSHRSKLETTNSSSGVDGSKEYTTGKQTSTCCCSETCPFAYTATTSPTNTYSSQLRGKLSSATMEFFEDVIAKHKSKPRKSSTQDTTPESESECSTSSETDY